MYLVVCMMCTYIIIMTTIIIILIMIMIVLVIYTVYQFGMTALMRASIWGHKEVVQLLLDRGANKDIKDNKVSIIYTIACEFPCMNM